MIAAALCSAVPAHAIDWRLGTFFSQRFEADSNVGGDSGDDSGVNSITSLGATVSGNGQRTSFNVSTGVTGVISNTDNNLDNILPRITGDLSHAANRRLSFSAGLSIVPELTNGTSFEENNNQISVNPDRSNGTALVIAGRANGVMNYRIDPTTDFNTGLFASTRRVVESGGIDINETNQYGLTLGLSRRLTPETGVGLNGGYRFFENIDDDSDSHSTNLGVSVNRRFTPSISGTLNLGGGYTVSEDDSSFNFVGGAQGSFRTADINFSAGVSSDLDQNDEGEVEQRLSAFVSSSYAFTDRWRGSLGGVLSAGSPLSDTEDGDVVLSISPGLSYALTQDWRVGVGYRFRSNLSDSDEGVSNLVFFQIARNFQFPF